MKSMFLILILFVTNFLYTQNIIRKKLDYSINGCDVFRLTNSEVLIYESPNNGELFMTLYSDSTCNIKQTINLLVCYPKEIKGIDAQLIIHYTDKTNEYVPNFPDANNCSVYYFINRLEFILTKKVKSMTFVGIGTYTLEDRNYFKNFIKKL
jgi:hypothetical protein